MVQSNNVEFNSNHRTGYRVFVTGLPPSWSSPDLDSHSLQYGLTSHTKVDGVGGGLVEFREAKSAEAACKDRKGRILFNRRSVDYCLWSLKSSKGHDMVARGSSNTPEEKTAADGSAASASSMIWTCTFAQPTPRYLGPRASITVCDQSLFEHPFEVITTSSEDEEQARIHRRRSQANYPLQGNDGILRALPGRPILDPADFPHGIRHWIWANSNSNDTNNDRFWSLLCQLENGLYAFYYADASYTGFDCHVTGGMSLYLAPEPESLIFFAMTDHHYSDYEKGTQPAPAWTACDAESAERRLAWAMLGHARLGAAVLPWAAAVGGDADALGKVGAAIYAVPESKQWTREALREEKESSNYFQWAMHDSETEMQF